MLPSPNTFYSAKHYYAGEERVCARIGSGLADVLGDADSLEEKATHLFRSCNNTIHSRVHATEDCSNAASGAPTVMGDSVYVSLNAFQERMNHLAYGSAELYDDGVFFYHPDHLGSASWVTDGSGMPIQHLQYLPFGESYVSEHTASPYTERFTFTGKERDEETGYTYHGARYYDANLMCSWFSVDPLSDKYPSLSPYNYCAWNPVKLVDPDGREIAVTINNNVYTLRSFRQTECGWTLSWVDETGKEVSLGNDDFSKSVNQAISSILDLKTGKDLVSYLLGSSNRCLITPSSDGGCHFNSESNEVQFASQPDHEKNTGGYSYNYTCYEKADDNTCPAYIGLAHEFAHCADFWLGKTEDPNGVWDTAEKMKGPIRNAERYAMTVENYIRHDNGLPQRLWYFYDGEQYYGSYQCEYNRNELFSPNKK